MNLDRLLKSLLSNPAATGLAGAVAGGLLASKGGRRLGKKTLEVGGMVALAGLAYSAWQRHQRGPGDETPSPTQLRDAGFLPATSNADSGEAFDTAVFRAMVAAARCDGRLDVEERRTLVQQIEVLNLSEAERAEFYAQIERPASLDEIVASATTPQRALELYTASRIALEPDTPAERGYLVLLAARLGLDDALLAEVEARVSGESDPRSTHIESS